MMKTISFWYLFSALVVLNSCGKDKDETTSPFMEWQSVTGGKQSDLPRSIAEGKNGEYIVVGVTYNNYGNNSGDITNIHGGFSDALVTKLDANGNKVWVKAFGGSEVDEAWSVAATPDGNFIVAGFSGSQDGDVPKKMGYDDFWIMKIDTDGKIIWSKTYGSTSEDQAHAVAVTPDGGCVVTGFTEGNNGDVEGNNNNQYNLWILKLDASGSKQWTKMYGGSNVDGASGITSCPDGGYAITGYSRSNDGDVTGHHGNSNMDIWVLKIDGQGNKQWDKSFGGTNDDYGQSIMCTANGGLVVSGTTNSADGEITGYHQGNNLSDACILKLDIAGNINWAKAYGGFRSEGAYSIVAGKDGGYVFNGSVTSADGDVSGYPAGGQGSDHWLVKLDEDGNIKWNNCYGSTGRDAAYSMISTRDNGYILTGVIQKGDRDVTVQTYGGDYDWWTFKIKSL